MAIKEQQENTTAKECVMAEFIFIGDFAFPNLAKKLGSQERLEASLREALVGELAPYVKLRAFVTDFRPSKKNRKLHSFEEGNKDPIPISDYVQILLLPGESIDPEALTKFLTKLLGVTDELLELEYVLDTQVFVGGKKL